MDTLNESALKHAFDGTSWHPEKRAQSVRDSFVKYKEEYRQAVAGLENEAELIASFDSGLAKRFNEWIGAQSRCLSWAITGPARFPVRKAQAASNSEREKLKKNGFRWSPKNKAWQAFINYRSESFIKREFIAD